LNDTIGLGNYDITSRADLWGIVLKTFKYTNVLILLLALLAVSSLGFAKRTILFSTPPTQSYEVTMKRYGPLADFLTKKLGRKVKLVPAANFIDYSQAMLENRYDLIFDGPHFIGWRIIKQNHYAIAKLPGKLNFAIIVKKGSSISHYKKLAGKRVCGVGSPNLMTLGMLDLFPNPASVPVVVPSRGFKGALKCVKAGNAVAAVVPAKFWKKRPPKVKASFKVLFISPILWPPRGFSIGDRVDSQTQQRIHDLLLSPEATKAAKNILKRYKSNRFVGANNKEYRSLNKLLRPIWGFHN